MQKISIRSRNPPRPHVSPNSAISSAKQKNNALLHEINVDSLFGRAITGVAYTEAACGLQIDNRYTLAIDIDENGGSLRCKIHPFNASTSLMKNETPCVMIDMGGTRFEWNRQTIINNIIGRRFENLFYNGIDIYVYIAGGTVISFSSVIADPDRRPFLYWSFAD